MLRWLTILCLGLTVPCGVGPLLGAANVKPLLAKIKAVGGRGEGNKDASLAWRDLAKAGPEALLPTLAALDDANPIAANWLRSAVEVIADDTLAAGKQLPAHALEKFVLDRTHAGSARRLAYECLARVDATAPKRLIPGMINDPSAELRRDAVALAIAGAEKLFAAKDEAAVAAFRKALDHARDRDQVEQIAKRLKELNAPVDLTAQFGFIAHWMLVGPFDNTAGSGFKTVYPPEKKVDLAEKLTGKKKAELKWIEHTTKLPYGMVDLNVALGKNMGAVAYAYTVVHSPKERPVQLRAGSNNAVQIFLNGKRIYFREEYHHGNRMDQHIGTGTLRAGSNEILVKVCQNEQSDSWAQLWSFQLRVTDGLGGKVTLEPALKKPLRQARLTK